MRTSVSGPWPPPPKRSPAAPRPISPSPSRRRLRRVEELVVTGSRIVRNGNEAPTPTTVLSAEDIQERNPTNIADYLTQLPSMGTGNTPRTTTLFANATGGANQLSARDLGVTRTLVLLDGRRVVGSGMSPAVDVNLLPQNLVQRVDVVTGGASAAYGSDAVAGVVNFILDTKFTGLKGSFNFSQTDYSDGRSSPATSPGAPSSRRPRPCPAERLLLQGRPDRLLRQAARLVPAGPSPDEQSGLDGDQRPARHRSCARCWL
jgi:outer membrane receptor protein involved in Fe transport